MFKYSLIAASFGLAIAGAAHAAQPAPQPAPETPEAASENGPAQGMMTAPQEKTQPARPGSATATPGAADTRQPADADGGQKEDAGKAAPQQQEN